MKIKKYIHLAAVLISAPFFLASCGEKKADDGKADTEAAAAKPYTLDTCLVSGEELGSMGDPYVFVHEGQEIKMCCKKCLKKFNADPDKYIAMLNKGETASEDHDHDDHSGHNH